jgi:capsular exopolysaccharide synthesis family protein
VEPINYLRAFRRRWLVIVAAVVVAVAVGWATTETVAPVRPRSVTYSATTVLWSTASLGVGVASSPITDTTALASVATLPDVLVLAAGKLGLEGDPIALGSRVQVLADTEANFLHVTAAADDPLEAERTAEAVASSLIQYLRRLRAAETHRRVQAINRQIELLEAAGAPPETVAIFEGAVNDALVSRTLPIGLAVLQHAVAREVPATGFQVPQSRAARLLIAASIGLAAGLGLALVLERFDTKIRTRQAAEQAFGSAVLVEIPVVGRRQRKRVAVIVRPTGPAADAFRLLAAAVTRAGSGPADPTGNGRPAPNGDRPDAPRTILVTSPGPADGKTFVAANLAAAFRELGKRVLVLSADLRKPSIHRPFGVPVAPGLADALADPSGRVGLEVSRTEVDGVRLIPSGLAAGNPGELLASPRMGRVLEATGRMADVTVLDTSPILVGSDVAPLLTKVDAVVLVARANRTRKELAQRAGDVLRRLDAPVVGIALNCSTELSMPSGSRRHRVRATRKRGKAPRSAVPPMPPSSADRSEGDAARRPQRKKAPVG